MPGMFESGDFSPFKERHPIRTVEDIRALFGGRTAQQVFDMITRVVHENELKQAQQAAQNEEAS